MRLTVLYRSKKFSFAFQFGKRQLVAGLVLLFGVITISSRSTQPIEESHARVNFAQSGLEAQQKEVEMLKAVTRDQVTGMMLKLGDIQGEIHRINALGAKLVEQANLNPEEFSFHELSATGGPTENELAEYPVDNTLVEQIDSMLEKLEDKSQQLLALESILMNHHMDNKRYLSGRPVTSGWLSSYYGMRKDPFSGLPAMHKGIDFAGKTGDDVVATGAGLVIWSGERFGYGNLVEIDHGDGLVTRYGHNKELSVKIGDVVTRGQAIAKMGSTGRSTGAHVHYEVLKDGKQQDPLPYVYRKP